MRVRVRFRTRTQESWNKPHPQPHSAPSWHKIIAHLNRTRNRTIVQLRVRRAIRNRTLDYGMNVCVCLCDVAALQKLEVQEFPRLLENKFKSQSLSKILPQQWNNSYYYLPLTFFFLILPPFPPTSTLLMLKLGIST